MKARDTFSNKALDTTHWLPHYLPAWSSLQDSRAHYNGTGDALQLFIPIDAPLWCADTHPTPLRVSGIQSANRSGPVGSTDGQQRFLPDLKVREEQKTLRGWLPTSGRITIRCLMELNERSMAAMWLSGFEESPHESGELCVVEVFGRSVKSGTSAEVGVGVKAKFDPELADDFIAPRIDIDVSNMHDYAVEWDSNGSIFQVDGETIHSTQQTMTYPMQLMVAVFDFPDWPVHTDDFVPRMIVDSIGIDE